MNNILENIKDANIKNLLQEYQNAKTIEEKMIVAQKQKELQDSMTDEELKEYNREFFDSMNNILSSISADIEELRAERIREKMGQLDKAISFAYIAKNYFGKSQSWLMQRLNGSKVNGKEARFNRAEVLQLQNAIHDLGHKLSSLTLL